MEVTTKELYESIPMDVEKLRKERGVLVTKLRELKSILREEKIKETKLKEHIDSKLNEQKMWEFHGESYGIVARFYKRAMTRIYETIPTIKTCLNMRLIEKAITRGANIFEGYVTSDDFEKLNKSFATIMYTIEKYLGENVYNNYELFHRNILNKIEKTKEEEIRKNINIY